MRTCTCCRFVDYICAMPPHFDHSELVERKTADSTAIGRETVTYECDRGYNFESGATQASYECEMSHWTPEFVDCTRELALLQINCLCSL